MKSQIFKKDFDKSILISLLQLICDKNQEQTCFILSKEAFKRGKLVNSIDQFVTTMKAYYHISKLHYIERMMNYKNFLSVIRQICNFKDIHFDNIIVYDKSKHCVEYLIQIE